MTSEILMNDRDLWEELRAMQHHHALVAEEEETKAGIEPKNMGDVHKARAARDRLFASKLKGLIERFGPAPRTFQYRDGHVFAGIDPKSPEGQLRSALWDLLGGMGAESVEDAARRVVRERDEARRKATR